MCNSEILYEVTFWSCNRISSFYMRTRRALFNLQCFRMRLWVFDHRRSWLADEWPQLWCHKAHLSHLVLGSLHALELFLLRRRLTLLNLLLVLLLKEQTLRSLLKVGDLLELDPVLMVTHTHTHTVTVCLKDSSTVQYFERGLSFILSLNKYFYCDYLTEYSVEYLITSCSFKHKHLIRYLQTKTRLSRSNKFSAL